MLLTFKTMFPALKMLGLYKLEDTPYGYKLNIN